MYWTVKQLTQELEIPKTSLLRVINEHQKTLDKYIRVGKRKRFEISDPGKVILEQMVQTLVKTVPTEPIEPDRSKRTEPIEPGTGKEECKKTETNYKKEDETVLNQSGSQVNQDGSVIKMFKEEIHEKNELIKTLIENQEKERERSAQDRERTDTIIMKMTNDMEQVRSENRLLLEESKKKEEPKKSEPKKTDRVISIQEFIAAKIEEDIERSNYEAEKKRLKQQYDNPLQGRSALYKIYVKMFRPDMLRKYV
ncbi:hypothetical protein KAJ27_04255 [bacterium]|nr:hypothetical protein [bacterium]